MKHLLKYYQASETVLCKVKFQKQLFMLKTSCLDKFIKVVILSNEYSLSANDLNLRHDSSLWRAIVLGTKDEEFLIGEYFKGECS